MNLAEVLIGNPDDKGRVPTLRTGVVTAVSPLTVRVGSAETAQSCNAIGSYNPAVDDLVSVLVIGGDRLVLGVAGTTGDAAHLTYFPAGNTDATTSAAWVDWLTIGTVDVPAWARKVDVWGTIAGHFEITNAGNTYVLQVTVGGVGTTFGGWVTGTGINVRMNHGVGGEITLSGSGTQAVKVQAYRIGGTGQWRADPATGSFFQFRFLP